TLGNLGGARSRDRSTHNFAICCHRPVAEVGHGSPHGCNPQDFDSRGNTVPALSNSVFDHRCHTGPPRGKVDGAPVRSWPDKIVDFILQFEQLKNPVSSAISRAAASFTAGRFINAVSGPEAERIIAAVIVKVLFFEDVLALAPVTK